MKCGVLGRAYAAGVRPVALGGTYPGRHTSAGSLRGDELR